MRASHEAFPLELLSSEDLHPPRDDAVVVPGAKAQNNAGFERGVGLLEGGREAHTVVTAPRGPSRDV